MAVDLTIRRGGTFNWKLRPEQTEQRYVAVAAIDRTAPVRIYAVDHGLLPDWRFLVVGAKGMSQINARNNPPRASDYMRAKVIDADTIEVNRINAMAFGAYTGGAVVQYSLPMNLAGYTVRGQVRKTAKSTEVLLDLGLYATIDAANCAITFSVPPAVTAALVGTGGVFDIELVASDGTVIPLPQGTVKFTDEVTK